MNSTTASLAQAGQNVNQVNVRSASSARIYPAQVKASVRAAQAKLTPEERERHNAHAAKLRAQNLILLAGPTVEGHVIRIPSWRWNPELVREIKSRSGYHFEESLPYTLRVNINGKDYTPTVTMPTWTVPAEPGRLEALQAIYKVVFAGEIALANWSN